MNVGMLKLKGKRKTNWRKNSNGDSNMNLQHRGRIKCRIFRGRKHRNSNVGRWNVWKESPKCENETKGNKFW
jgi:hypothetical protein